MEILVYLDDDDKAYWNSVMDLQKKTMSLASILQRKTPTEEEQNELTSLAIATKNKTSDYWHDMIEKYGVLRDKPLTMDILGEYIYVYGSAPRNR